MMVIFFWGWRCAITQQTTATEPTNQAPEMFVGMRSYTQKYFIWSSGIVMWFTQFGMFKIYMNEY